ncbi:MAG: acyl-CoA dehydrogenase [Candidatus Eremiobacteraeota bacterium]|nr:acyl-CoA dehydrogenase [Candidatus Eremiobacteraeota bacterium]MBC5803245.1 acyl-CoA dehydrogenase [Candidatus Eremiobacteraeota bacterium]MBC5822266.1 acyl-CoA dehydrogenase [Candidatus Eremiobacteraeota bacterium]
MRELLSSPPDGRRQAAADNALGLEESLFTLACSDARGVPLAGRAAELVALRVVGARDLSLARLYEGHLNGAQLVARHGTAEQRARSLADIGAGRVFGVWNTQEADDPLRISIRGDGITLDGAKTWASGAGTITRPVVTALRADGTTQLCLIPIERVATAVDRSGWRPHGMQRSDSFRIAFDGVELRADDLIGAPGAYDRQPWFWGGAWRFAAAQSGAVERLFVETAAYLRARGRDGDTFQRARLAEMRMGLHCAVHWLRAAAAAWSDFDTAETAAGAARVIDVVDMARTSVETIAVDTIARVLRSVGASGLIEPQPFGPLVRDLEMYLRQPAPDAAVVRIGIAAFAEAQALHKAMVASSTDCDG